VWVLTGFLALALAAVCGVLRGPADAVGALVGGVVTLVNFGGLTWAAGRIVGNAPRHGPALWIGASGLRLALVACLTGLVLTQTEIGLAGLVLSLTLVPVAVVLAGLRAARAV
jgi:hypothetical protein